METNTRDSLISRRAAIKTINKVRDVCDTESLDDYRDLLTECFEVMPPAQTGQPDIIACGDCKYWICHDRRCGFWNHGAKPLDWCSYAERREGEADG